MRVGSHACSTRIPAGDGGGRGGYVCGGTRDVEDTDVEDDVSEEMDDELDEELDDELDDEEW